MFQSLTGIEYLKADIACKQDKSYEKATWDDRIAYYSTLDLEDKNTFKTAHNPIGLRAAALAMKKVKNKEPSGYMIELDACSSGLQILSVLVSCPESLSLCGSNPTKCVDAYTEIYKAMGTNTGLTRKQVKKTIMTSLYGSVATPLRTFGENIELFYDTMKDKVPGAWDLNIGLQELWDEVKGSSYSWTLPDNFHGCIETKKQVYVPFVFCGEDYKVKTYVNERPDFHKGLGPNIIHSIDGFIVREVFRRCMYDPEQFVRVVNALDGTGCTGTGSALVKQLWSNYQETGFLSVRILDGLNEDTMGLVDSFVIGKLLSSLPEKNFDVVSVHDCFRVHPSHGNDLRLQYNQVLCDIKNSEMLTSISSQVAQRTVKARKVGVIPDKTLLNANYMLA